MADFKPSTFTSTLVLLVPTYSASMGVPTKAFPSPENGFKFYGSFKTYGGTERDINGLYTIEDTAQVECWYNPQITSECRVYLPETQATYEIINEPEDIDLRHQFMKFKVRRLKGGA